MIIITTQCFPPDRGGIEMLMGGLADALHARGEAVAVYADRAHVEATDHTPYTVKRFGGFNPLRRRLKAYAVVDAVRAQKVAGVFANSWKSVELLAPLAVPNVVLAHGMEFPAAPSTRKKARIATALAKAHMIIANSGYTASLVMPYLTDGEARLRIINPPIGPQSEATPEALSGIREIVSGRGPVLLTLARLEPRKGVDMVIRALPEILKLHPKAVYVIAGGGEDRARLEKVALEAGVARSVHFAGPVQRRRQGGIARIGRCVCDAGAA